MTGSRERARAALASRDFRRLLGARLTSQFADGLFQAYLVAELVFLDPDRQGTALGVAKAFALLVIPFSVVGPFAGVLIDRWSRRAILFTTPAVRTLAAVALVPVGGEGPLLYALALVVLSLNRFFLATAAAVTPSLVPEEDLLVANSMSTVGGTVLTFAGLVVGTQIAEPLGGTGLLLVTAAWWPVSSFAASRISGQLRPERPPGLIGAQLRRMAGELAGGIRRLAATPAALGSIVSVSLDQFLIGLVTVLGVVVFKERFGEGVASYGRMLAAGGVGVLLGTITVGWFESRLTKPQIVALAFALAGVACLAAAPFALSAPAILSISFALGLTFSWRKIPVDTIVQESVPDRFRGRVFAVYDILYAMARVVAALLAVALIPRLSTGWLIGVIGVIYLAWTPVLPAWVRRPRWAEMSFYAGGKADEVPRTISVAGEEEPVEMVRSWTEERDGQRLRGFRVRTSSGERMDLVAGPGSSRWRIESSGGG